MLVVLANAFLKAQTATYTKFLYGPARCRLVFEARRNLFGKRRVWGFKDDRRLLRCGRASAARSLKETFCRHYGVSSVSQVVSFATDLILAVTAIRSAREI
jgi:hypothetical protein